MGPLVLSLLWGQCEDPLALLGREGDGAGAGGDPARTLALSPAPAALLWSYCLDTAVRSAAQPPQCLQAGGAWRVPRPRAPGLLKRYLNGPIGAACSHLLLGRWCVPVHSVSVTHTRSSRGLTDDSSSMNKSLSCLLR